MSNIETLDTVCQSELSRIITNTYQSHKMVVEILGKCLRLSGLKQIVLCLIFKTIKCKYMYHDWIFFLYI